MAYTCMLHHEHKTWKTEWMFNLILTFISTHHSKQSEKGLYKKVQRRDHLLFNTLSTVSSHKEPKQSFIFTIIYKRKNNTISFFTCILITSSLQAFFFLLRLRCLCSKPRWLANWAAVLHGQPLFHTLDMILMPTI